MWIYITKISREASSDEERTRKGPAESASRSGDCGESLGLCSAIQPDEHCTSTEHPFKVFDASSGEACGGCSSLLNIISSIWM